MSKRKRKTLPKDFAEMLDQATLAALIGVFDSCELEARGGYSKSTALGFYNCPDALVHWLVEQGADINAGDSYQRTPLHHRSSSWKGGVALLLDLGADIEARDYQGATPLMAAIQSHKPKSVEALIRRGANVHVEHPRGYGLLQIALGSTRNADIVNAAEIAEMLLAAGVPVADTHAAEVERIGREFEFHRASFNPDYLEATDAALARLYTLFNVTPIATRKVHDGASPIVLTQGRWQDQHQALWELLVPSNGAAATLQGEVIRLSGRISREILHNGGSNWDAEFKAMLEFLVEQLSSNQALPAAQLEEARSVGQALRSGNGDAEPCARLCELAVQWVGGNPQPIALPTPGYNR